MIKQNTPYRAYGIKNCDTMKKALAYLTEHGIAFEFIDYKKADVAAIHLPDWAARAGWEKLLNTRGMMWRKLSDAQRADVDEKEALALLKQASEANPSYAKAFYKKSEVEKELEEWESAEQSLRRAKTLDPSMNVEAKLQEYSRKATEAKKKDFYKILGEKGGGSIIVHKYFQLQKHLSIDTWNGP